MFCAGCGDEGEGDGVGISGQERRLNEKSGTFGEAASGPLRMQRNWILREVTIDRGYDRFLIVGCGQVPSNSGKSEPLKHRRNILMFELDRPFAPIDLASEKAVMLGFIKGNASSLVVEH
jgi:hypothetical protein